MNSKAKGSAKERQSKRLLEEAGYKVTKAGGSLGAADLVALKAGEPPLMIQVKASSSRWKNFSPAERTELLETADQAGAVPVLAWWRPRASVHELIAAPRWP